MWKRRYNMIFIGLIKNNADYCRYVDKNFLIYLWIIIIHIFIQIIQRNQETETSVSFFIIVNSSL